MQYRVPVKHLLIALAATLPALADDSKATHLVAQGDAEQSQHHTRAALALFEQAEKLDPANPALLLRISRAYSDLVEETKPPEDARDAGRSLDYAKRGLSLDPGGAKAHLAVAVAYGKLTDFVGNKTKLEYSKVIKSEAEKSLAIDAGDDFAWYLLGRWNYGVANVNGLLKALSTVVYGGLPPASNEEAVRCFKKAIEIAPQRLVHHSALARAYTSMGNRELAAKEWRTVLSLPATTSEEETDKAEARKALK